MFFLQLDSTSTPTTTTFTPSSIPEEEAANKTENEDNEARDDNLRHKCSSRYHIIFNLRQPQDEEVELDTMYSFHFYSLQPDFLSYSVPCVAGYFIGFAHYNNTLENKKHTTCTATKPLLFQEIKVLNLLQRYCREQCWKQERGQSCPWKSTRSCTHLLNSTEESCMTLSFLDWSFLFVKP